MTAAVCGIVLALMQPVPAILDQTITLDGTERKIEGGPYQASVQAGIERPVSVHAGVAIEAAHLTAVLRGARGTLRFHGDVSRLSRIISQHNGRAVKELQ